MSSQSEKSKHLPPDLGVEGSIDDSEEKFGGGLLCEGRRLWTISFPMVLASTSIYIMGLSSLVILGTFAGPSDLAAASMGTVYSNVCGCSLLWGLSEAIDTLCSQAYGAKQYRLMGIFLQRGVVILCLASTLASVAFYFTETVLLALGQNPELSKNAAGFVQYQIPGIYSYAVCMAFQRFLSAQETTSPLFWISAAALPVHIWLTLHLVRGMGLGKEGAAIAWSISFTFRAVALCGYTFWIEMSRPSHMRSLTRINLKAAFRGWGRLLAISVPAYAMVATEWWSFEFLTLMAGLLPDPQTKVIAQTICSNIIGFMFMFSLGLSVAVCVRVGNALGAKRVDCVRRTILASIGICIFQWALVGGILMLPFVRNNLSLLFAPSTAGSEQQSIRVQSVVSVCLGYVVLQQFFDGLKEIFNGAIRGCGRQSIGMGTSFVSYFMLCLPLAYCLAFGKIQTRWSGIEGLFVATVCASTTHAILNGCVIASTDWRRVVESCSHLNLMTRQQSQRTVISPKSAISSARVSGNGGYVDSNGALLPLNDNNANNRKNKHYDSFKSSSAVDVHVTLPPGEWKLNDEGDDYELPYSPTFPRWSNVGGSERPTLTPKLSSMTPTKGSPILFPMPILPPDLTLARTGPRGASSNADPSSSSHIPTATPLEI